MLALENRQILVTGGSGFLGSHLLPQLTAGGAQVRCLVRSAKSAAKLPPNVTPVYGDCLSLPDLEKAASGCDSLIHMAATLFGNNWQDYLKTNSAAAFNIAALVKNGSLKKIVHISSLAAAGPCAAAPGRNEAQTPTPVSAYGWSKLSTEQIIQAALPLAASKPGLVILRPPIIYGSGDLGLLPMFKSCKYGIGLSPGRGNFPVSIIHAKDAARAILLALTHPKANGVYHLSDGVAYTMEGICRAMGQALERSHIRVLKPPLPLMAATALLGGGFQTVRNSLSRLFGANPGPPMKFNMDKWREAAQPGWLADNTHISRELNFKPQITLAQGMAEAVAGYRQAGLV